MVTRKHHEHWTDRKCYNYWHMGTPEKTIIIYDQDCAFCTWWVLFVLKRDKQKKYFFTSLSSLTAQTFFQENNITDAVMIWLLLPDKTYYNRSSASIRIISGLGGIYRFTQLALLVPRPFRDWVYTLISNHRKALIRNNVCPIVPDAYSEQFIV
jgi:predicted DCC family thiol-disulfide oxidoreductase YuxK